LVRVLHMTRVKEKQAFESHRDRAYEKTFNRLNRYLLTNLPVFPVGREEFTKQLSPAVLNDISLDSVLFHGRYRMFLFLIGCSQEDVNPIFSDTQSHPLVQ